MILIQYLISSLIPAVIYQRLYGTAKKRKIQFSLIFIVFLCSTILIDILDRTGNSFFSILSLALSLTISFILIPKLYKVSVKKVFSYVFIKYSLTVIINLSFYIFFSDLYTKTNEDFIIFFQETVLSFIGYYLAYYIWKKTEKQANYDFPILIYTFPILIVGLLSMYFPLNQKADYVTLEKFPLPFIGVLLLFIVYSFLLITYMKRLRVYFEQKTYDTLSKEERRISEKNIHDLYQKYCAIRKIQHDLKNHIITLELAKQTKSKDEYQKYAEQIINEIKSVNKIV